MKILIFLFQLIFFPDLYSSQEFSLANLTARTADLSQKLYSMVILQINASCYKSSRVDVDVYAIKFDK